MGLVPNMTYSAVDSVSAISWVTSLVFQQNIARLCQGSGALHGCQDGEFTSPVEPKISTFPESTMWVGDPMIDYEGLLILWPQAIRKTYLDLLPLPN